jgi:hypothetical protein
MKKYRRQGFGTFLIKDAINKFGGYDLTVDKDNEIAIKMYKKYGFKIDGDGNSKKEYYMILNKKKSLNESISDKRITDLDKIIEFNKILNRYQYGFYNGRKYSGKILDNERIFMDKYKLMDSKTVRTYQICVCWDAVRYEAEWFKENVPNIPFKCYYCEYEPKIGNSHTWLMFKYNGKDYIFESTWKSKQGVKEVNKDELIKKYISDIPKDGHTSKELLNARYALFEYDPISEKPGLSCIDFMDSKWKNGKFVKTNCKSFDEVVKKFEFDENDNINWNKYFNEEYEPPMSLKEIKQKYGNNLYNKLKSDPVHKWRAETGIELIHKEPSKKELERIMKNWEEMNSNQKEISDKKSLELFNCTNRENYKRLIKTYKEPVNPTQEFINIIKKYQKNNKSLVIDSKNNFITFIGIGKEFSLKNEDQYNTIGHFWDCMGKLTDKDDLIGFGCNWTRTTMDYYIGFVNEYNYNELKKLLEKEFNNLKIKKFVIPMDNWTLYKGYTKDISKMYDEIWTDKVVTAELEFCTNDGKCYLLINKENDPMKYLNESIIIPEKNFEINIDQWREGNPLWITGSSGDGKSTYANMLTEKHNAYLVHLDLFLGRICRPKEKYEKWLKSTNGTINSNGTEMTLEYINQHPELPWMVEQTYKWDEFAIYWNDFFDWILHNAKYNPKYRNKKIIVEGCDICYMPPEKAIKLPLIIMGTSELQSSIRRIKRDRPDGRTLLKDIFREIKRSRGYIKDLNRHKDEFKKALIKELNESVNFHIKVYHASKEYYKKLKSVGLDFGNMFQEEGFSLYTWTKYKSAIGWGCFEVLKTLKKIDENVTILGCKNSQNPIITKSVYNYLKDNLYKYNKKLLEFYIYTIQLNSDMELGLGHSSNTPNCITIRQTDDIDYSKVEKYQMTIDMLKKNCIIVDDNYIPTKKDIGVDGRLLTPFMTKDYMYQTGTKKQLSNDLKIGKLTPNDNLHDYLINNNMELKKIRIKDRIKQERLKK